MRGRLFVAVVFAFVIGFIVGVQVIRASRPASAPAYDDLAFRSFDLPLPTPSPGITPGPMDVVPRVSRTPAPTVEPQPTPWPTHPPKPKLAGGPYKPWRRFDANVMAARTWLDVMLDKYQFRCIDVLFDRESRWRVHAENRHSGAYGIPQALPGRKMAKYGADWRDNAVTQVKWGYWYIRARYGNPCIALDHSYRTGWY